MDAHLKLIISKMLNPSGKKLCNFYPNIYPGKELKNMLKLSIIFISKFKYFVGNNFVDRF